MFGLALTVLVSLSCGSADAGTAVTLRNDSAMTVRVREVGINSGSDLVSELSPGGERKTLWHFTNGSTVTLRVEDLGGQSLRQEVCKWHQAAALSDDRVIGLPSMNLLPS